MAQCPGRNIFLALVRASYVVSGAKAVNANVTLPVGKPCDKESPMLEVKCPSCGRIGLFSSEVEGRTVKCSQCGEKHIIEGRLPTWFYREEDEANEPLFL